MFPPLFGTGAPEMVAMALMHPKKYWDPNAESRRAVWASTVAVPNGTDLAGNIGPQAAETAEESAEGVSCVGPQAAEAAGEDAESASGVGNIVPHKVEETEKIESAVCVSSVVNRVPRGVKKTSTRAEVLLNTSRVDNQVPHSESETPPPRPVEEQYHVFDGVSGRQVKTGSAVCVSSVVNRVPRGVKKTSTRAEVLLNTSRVDNQVPHSEAETPPARPVEEQCHVFDGASGHQVKAGAVHLEALPEVSALLNLEDHVFDGVSGRQVKTGAVHLEALPEVLALLNLEELSMKAFLAELKAGEIVQRAEILKNPEDPVYPLVKEYSDAVSKHPPTQFPPDRGVRHEIDLVPGTKYCVTRRTRQWSLPHEQCEVIDAFFAEKAKFGMEQ
ncbi:Pol protein [Phytophthora palmivora]|uniref:Pol protein n=1 Tax=Phytophthora palmivora TaxID=4796 RepID=A0A2P4Y5W2_9STRA|nr:Pol protein [Phytophthora palmivora]